MRFLADAGISPRTVQYLRDSGHDVVHVRDLAMQRASDRSIADRARLDGRIVLTFDLDFGAVLALGVVERPSVVISAFPTSVPKQSTGAWKPCFPRSSRHWRPARSSSSKTRDIACAFYRSPVETIPRKSLERQGYVSIESAREDYGVEFDPKEIS